MYVEMRFIMGILENEKKTNELLNYYGLSREQQREFWNIIRHIFNHEEFQRRMSKDFPHHGEITLGEHILSDAAMTYKLTESSRFKRADFDRKTAVIIAMFHDLYTLNWQNNPDNFVNNSYNKHAFRHPIEAIINAVNFYPEYFEDDNTYKIIDGVIHHMFPVPVKRFDGSPMELKNEDAFDKIPDRIKNLIVFSSNRGFNYNHFSICRSTFLEGRIMSRADKLVSIRNYIDDIEKNGPLSILTLFTGVNKNLENYEKTTELKKRR